MKVLGISGSPRRGGNTDLLLAEFLRGAAGKGAEVETIILNDLDFIACQHCDACLQKGKCKYEDDMQMIYGELAAADRIVLASPIHFVGLSAQMKAMIDRCQALWARKYILKIPPLGDRRERKGFFISVGGTKGQRMFEGAILTVRYFFDAFNADYTGELLFRKVDACGDIRENSEALPQAFAAGRKLVSDLRNTQVNAFVKSEISPPLAGGTPL